MAEEQQLEEAVRAADERATSEPVAPRMVFRWALAAGLGLLAVYLGYRAVLLMADVLVQVVIAAFIAVSLDPAVRWLVRHRVRRGQAVAVILLGFLLMFALLLWLFLPPLIRSGSSPSGTGPPSPTRSTW